MKLEFVDDASEASGGSALQQAEDHVLGFGADVWREGYVVVLVDDPSHDFHLVVGARVGEGLLAGEEDVGKDAEAPPVDGAGVAAGEDVLRCDVSGGATEGICLLPGLEHLGKAKVAELGVAPLVDEDVLRLEVAVDDVVSVEVLEGEDDGGDVELGNVFVDALEHFEALCKAGGEQAVGLELHVDGRGVADQHVHQVAAGHQVEEKVQVVLILEGTILPDAKRVGQVAGDGLLAEHVLGAPHHGRLAHALQRVRPVGPLFGYARHSAERSRAEHDALHQIEHHLVRLGPDGHGRDRGRLCGAAVARGRTELFVLVQLPDLVQVTHRPYHLPHPLLMRVRVASPLDVDHGRLPARAAKARHLHQPRPDRIRALFLQQQLVLRPQQPQKVLLVERVAHQLGVGHHRRLAPVRAMLHQRALPKVLCLEQLVDSPLFFLRFGGCFLGRIRDHVHGRRASLAPVGVTFAAAKVLLIAPLEAIVLVHRRFTASNDKKLAPHVALPHDHLPFRVALLDHRLLEGDLLLESHVRQDLHLVHEYLDRQRRVAAAAAAAVPDERLLLPVLPHLCHVASERLPVQHPHHAVLGGTHRRRPRLRVDQRNLPEHIARPLHVHPQIDAVAPLQDLKLTQFDHVHFARPEARIPLADENIPGGNGPLVHALRDHPVDRRRRRRLQTATPAPARASARAPAPTLVPGMKQKQVLQTLGDERHVVLVDRLGAHWPLR